MPNPLILIADANAHIRFFLKREFMAAGFDVVAASVHTEVLHLLQAEQKPDLIVLDPSLPFIDWDLAIARIRGKAPRIPVILYTPYAEELEKQDVSGPDAIVEKAPDPALLIQTARNLLDRASPWAKPADPRIRQNPVSGGTIE
ncbi:MAG: response regulator [Desulfobacteraceae bacterium]|nr:response regulator [Desulfobacteraceae bacterium]